MIIYRIEQAIYDLKWYKGEEELKTFGDEKTLRYSNPSCYHIRIYKLAKAKAKLVAFLSRPSYQEAIKTAKKYCGR